jgi:lipopolysaccharide/colanic/teichoic acid biosynthesis glycosyltransferase
MLAQHLTPSAHPHADHGRPFHVRYSTFSDRLKRLVDLTVALALSALALPVIATAWVLVRATTAGPGFYSQIRVGRNRREYRIYKIRTMYHNCEAGTGAAWCLKSDRRVTRVGRVLRKLHIDELPQLLNVLLGEMSLVGPRPERPEFVRPLSEQIPGYIDRLAVRPGVTGLAQIQLPPDTDVDDVRKKVILDRCYADNRGLWLDVRILMGTVVYLLGFSYEAVRRVMGLPNPLIEDDRPASDSRLFPVGSFTLSRSATEVDASLATGGAPIPCGETQ